MFIKKLFHRNGRSRDPRHEAAFDGLLSVEQLQSLLDRERARADRSGDGFSLLELSFPRSQQAHSAMVETAKILRQRLRSTDEAGWLDSRKIGVVLPSTPIEGARILAGDVLERCPDGGSHIRCRVYSYPTGATIEDRYPDEERPASRRPANGTPVHSMETILVRPISFWKRAVDVLVSSIALVLLFPLFAVVAAAIRITSPGPVLFAQQRSGQGGRPFMMYKFRSMVAGAERGRQELAPLNEQDGPAFKMRHDPRVTRLGRLMRATCIDELPQLWNVLRGDMSLVGPRPLPCDETDACDSWQRRRLQVVPGLTCTWQTCDRDAISFDEWMRMDVRYIRTRSLWQDMNLLLATVVVALRGDRY